MRNIFIFVHPISYLNYVLFSILVLGMIHSRSIKGENTTDESPTMKIGNNNVFEVGSTIETLMIGDNNVLECRSELYSSECYEDLLLHSFAHSW